MAKKRSHSPEDEEDDEIVDENRENGSYEHMEDDDGGEDEEQEHRRHKKSKSKKKKVRGVMNASGQTEAERRVLRRRQRELHEDIAAGVSSKTGEVGDVVGWREQNNDLWGNVRFTREAVLDSDNVDLIANKAAREAEKIVQVPRYDAIRLAQSLVKKGTIGSGPNAQFNWHNLGFEVGVCFSTIPSHVSFLYGPLDAEYTPKERKKVERRKKQVEEPESEAEEEEHPDDVNQTGKKKSDGNELSAVEQHISVIRHTLKERTHEENESARERANEYQSQLSQEIDDEEVVRKKTKKFVKENSHVSAVNCLFNPQSFTQTVENVFHFSFLVKGNAAGIKKRTVEEAEEIGGIPGPVICPRKENKDIPPPKQAIVSLNMKDWRDMCQAYNVEASDVPHRVHGKVAKKEKKARKSK